MATRSMKQKIAFRRELRRATICDELTTSEMRALKSKTKQSQKRARDVDEAYSWYLVRMHAQLS